MPRYARKRDQSEASIIAALEARGCLVVGGQDCDLYVLPPDRRLLFDENTQKFNHRMPLGFLVECKTAGPNEKRRQKIQQQLKLVFGNQYCIAKTPEEALKFMELS